VAEAELSTKLRSEKAIGVRVGRVIDRFKMAKHFALHSAARWR